MGVTFNEQNLTSSRRPAQKKEKGIIGVLLKTGLVKNKKQANVVMLVLIGCLCVISFFSLASLNSGGDADIITEEELLVP